MPVFNNILAGSSGQATGYTIDQSLRFNDDDSAYLSRTAGTATSNDIGTFSFWTKRGNLGGGNSFFSNHSDANNRTYIGFDADTITMFGKISGSANVELLTTPVFRDPGAWYHIVIAVDVTQSTASNRVKIYVNGTQITDFGTATYPAQNTDLPLFSKTNHQVGAFFSSSIGDYYDGYFAEYHYIDGQQLAPASFGETNSDTNQWQAVEYEGSYGNNGFYLKFQDASALGDDSSGNTNDFTANNLVATDQVSDSPSNSFATLNPLIKPAVGTTTYKEGNLKAQNDNWDAILGSQSRSSGKWYWEVVGVGATIANGYKVGITTAAINTNASISHDQAGSMTYQINGTKTIASTNTSYGASYAQNDIIGIAVDMDASTIQWYKNNAAQGSVSFSGGMETADSFVPLTSMARGSNDCYSYYNFGQDSSFGGNKTAQGNGGAGEDFYYTPPTGYKALNTRNLSASISDPTAHFNTVLYTGTGASHTISSLNFAPDFTWHKSRSYGSSNALFDSVRGGNKVLSSNGTDAEATNSDMITAFSSNGFTMGADATQAWINQSGYTYASWNWKAGGTAVSNSDGTETVSLSANPTAGFSVIAYTGTGTTDGSDTVGHGLSQPPELYFVKARTEASHDWNAYAKPIGVANYVALNLTNASAAQSNGLNHDEAPTSSVITLGYWNAVNESAKNFIIYAFHSVEGYSKVGSYKGNGNADGTFVYTGFRPAWLLIKKYDGAEDWIILDNKRDSYNVVRKGLYADLNNSEGASDKMDFTSNGFKIRSATGVINSSANFLYLAFAESPQKFSNAR